MPLLIAYITAFLVFVGIDFAWLGFVARDFYRAQIGPLIADPINLGAAAAFYAIYVLGIVVFAVQPALAVQSLMRAGVQGALFGFFAYATYDLTNLATLKNWPLQLVVADMAWGTFLTAITAVAAVMVAGRFV